MKERDILDIMGEIDEDLVADAAPQTEKMTKDTNKRTMFYRIGAAAACFTIILAGALVVRPFLNRAGMLFSDEDTSNKTQYTVGDESAVETNGMISNESMAEFLSPIETEEEAPCTEDCYEEYVPEAYLQYMNTDESFKGYSLTHIACGEENVGEKLTEIKLNYNWSDAPDEIFVCTAEVYEVKNRDGSISLCYKYTDTQGLFVQDGYYYMNINQAPFESLSQLISTVGLDENAIVDNHARYDKKTQYSYCDCFVISDDLADRIVLALTESDGEAKDSSLYGSMIGQVNERVMFALKSNDYFVDAEVMSNGYMFCTVLGRHAFYIGEKTAEKIIDLVISGEPVGYVWNEEYSEWYTICEEDEIRENPPKTFQEMLQLRDVFSNVTSFESKATYLATKIKPAPPYFTFDNATLGYIIKFIYELDGDMLSPYETVAPAYECVKLMLKNGSGSFEMHIFSAGYISFGGFDYFIGVDAVEKLISVVVMEGNPAPGYYWNADAQRWEIGNSDETYPPVSDDYDTTHYDTAPYDTEIVEEFETETMTEIAFETETEILVEFE